MRDTTDKTSVPIAIIIVNWNAGKWLKKCLEGVSKQTLCPERVLLIDNGSTDSSLDGVENLFPEIELVRLETNLGFAAANNLGIKKARGTKWIALLNPDAVPERDWLEKIYHAAEEFSDFQFFACQLRDALRPDLIDGEGDVYHIGGHAWRKRHGRSFKPQKYDFMECFSPCAAAALYKRRILVDVGGFDEGFFCYFEDIDLGFRLRLLGHRCAYIPNAIVYHAGSATTGKQSAFSVYYGHRNLIWTYFKNMPSFLFWGLLPCHIFVNFVAIGVVSIRGQGITILKAKIDAIRGMNGILRKRKAIQKSKRIPTIGIWRQLSKGVLPLLFR